MSKYPELDLCGCCEAPVPPTPKKIWNRQGLSTISYRMGTYAAFREAMIESIASAPELRRWTARRSDDYGIALLEMWAYLADILTFYQERIANEAFLRTALHPESVCRLAALLDYHPSPGLAAMVDLAFTVEKDKEVLIPSGLRVQSVPGQGERPQKFETVEEVRAYPKLNRFRVFPSPEHFNPLAMGSYEGEIVSDFKGAAGDMLLIFDSASFELKKITDVATVNNRTALAWTPFIQKSSFYPFTTKAALCSRQLQPFGYNAPNSYMEPISEDAEAGDISSIVWTLRETYVNYNLSKWPSLTLNSIYQDLKPGSKLLLVQSGSSTSSVRLATISEVSITPDKLGPIQDTMTKVSLDLGLTATPVIMINASNQLQVFTIGDDMAVWTIILGSEGDWSWSSLGGQVDMIAAGRNHDGQLEVFARGPDKALWHIWQLHPNGAWSQWARYGGWIDMLAVGRNKDGRLEVFARGSDKALWHIWQLNPNENEWSPPESLGRPIDMLAVGSNEDGRLEVFARGSDDKALWHIWQLNPNENEWSPPESLGGWIDRLDVGLNEDGLLEVFARGPDKALWHIRQTTANRNIWSQRESLGGSIDMLAVGRCHRGRINVFVTGEDKALVRYNRRSSSPVPSTGFNMDILGAPMWPIPDRRTLSIFELASEAACFYDYRYPDEIRGSRVLVPGDQLDGLDPERTAILDDKDAQPQTVLIKGANPVDSDSDGLIDHLAITFSPELLRSLDSGTAVLLGNVVKATHGETVKGEVLGDGDASTGFQSFSLKKSPLTFLPSEKAISGPSSTLELRAGGILWSEAERLFGHMGDDRIYIARTDEKGVTTLKFGDGVTGARLPTGRKNITATYRYGLGEAGNVRANFLTRLMDRPLGLKGVTNPACAEGGADPEILENTRTNAPNTIKTFNRIVSLKDFEDLARSYPGIAKALATWVWDGEDQVVFLTLAGDGGRAVGDTILSYLSPYLDSRRDPNRKLMMKSFREVPVEIEVMVQKDGAYLDEHVEAAARNALEDFFSFENQQLGQTIHLSEIFSVLHKAEGVVAVDINRLQYVNSVDRVIHGLADVPVPARLPIFGAYLKSTDPLAIMPAELARLGKANIEIGELK